MRGGHLAWLCRLSRWAGSSPRARGTLNAADHERLPRRFIPACAGDTDVMWSPPPAIPVHPRVRGGHRPFLMYTFWQFGSSPRARGTHPHPDSRVLPPRFIPACAGDTKCYRPRTPAKAVHPRVRGGHVRSRAQALFMLGSSPRARGTPHRCPRRRARSRFIPACAGDTLPTVSSSNCKSVHPRVRGGHYKIRDVMDITLGSSPRARGTRSPRRCTP